MFERLRKLQSLKSVLVWPVLAGTAVNGLFQTSIFLTVDSLDSSTTHKNLLRLKKQAYASRFGGGY